MKHIQKLLLFILALALSACSNTHASGSPVSSKSEISSASPVFSSASASASSSFVASVTSELEDIQSIIGTWCYVHPKTDVATPNSYSLEFHEDGTVYYMSGWENSESMEYRTGSFSDDDGVLTINMATIHITEEGLSYGYSDAEYSSVIMYELSGQKLRLTLISGDIPFVYMDYNVELVLSPRDKLQSSRFE